MSGHDTSGQLAASINQFLANQARLACLLVHPNPTQLRAAAHWLAARAPWPILRVGEALSAAPHDVAPRDVAPRGVALHDRPAAAGPHWSRDAAAHPPGPVLVTDVALLFEPALALDPLRPAARRGPPHGAHRRLAGRRRRRPVDLCRAGARPLSHLANV